MAEIDRHRRLTNYQYIGLHGRDEVWDEFRDENKCLACVRHLQSSLHDRQMCGQAGSVLTCMRNLTRLDVEGHRSISDETNFAIWRLILRTFSVEHELPHLRSLRLKRLRLIYDHDPLPQLIGLRNLEHLQLILCYDYVPLLRMLGTLSLDLKSFAVREGGDDDGTEFDRHANEFVRSMELLQRLSLILDPNWMEPNNSLLDWSALHAHAAGIKSLRLHCTFQHRLFALEEDESDFRHFCTKSSNLQQLSISGIAIQSGMPSYSAHERMPAQPGYLTHFLVCLRGPALDESLLTSIQDCLRTVRALKVLKPAFHYPKSEELRSRRDNEQHWRQRLAKSTADKILSELAGTCPELMVVVIEVEDDRALASESGSDSGSDNKIMPEYEDATYAFIRSKQTDPYGNTSTVGMAVETHMVKHYEPCSDILDPMGVFTSDH